MSISAEELSRYYDESYPPEVLNPPPPVVPATGATAGIPGTWTPPGSNPPASPAALAAGTPNAVVASPATAWTTGQYVQTATVGTGGRSYWNGTAWTAGTAAVTEEETMSNTPEEPDVPPTPPDPDTPPDTPDEESAPA